MANRSPVLIRSACRACEKIGTATSRMVELAPFPGSWLGASPVFSQACSVLPCRGVFANLPSGGKQKHPLLNTRLLDDARLRRAPRAQLQSCSSLMILALAGEESGTIKGVQQFRDQWPVRSTSCAATASDALERFSVCRVTSKGISATPPQQAMWNLRREPQAQVHYLTEVAPRRLRSGRCMLTFRK